MFIINKIISEKCMPEINTGLEYKLNVSALIYEKLHEAVESLKSDLKRISANAVLYSIYVSACSFTRGTMLKQSDIDELDVFIGGVSLAELSQLKENFIRKLADPLLKIGEGHADPRFMLVAGSKEGNLLGQRVGHTRLNLLPQGRLLTPLEMAELSGVPYEKNGSMVDKFSTRIKLLYLAGELADEIMSKMTSSSSMDFRQEMQLIRGKQLSKEALALIIDLDEQLISGQFDFMFQGSPEKLAQILKELMDYGLITIYTGKIILNWRMRNIRWGNGFWQELIAIKNTDDKNVLSGMQQEMIKRDPGLLRLQELSSKPAYSITEEEKTFVVDRLASRNKIQCITAFDLIKNSPKVFSLKIIELIKNTPLAVLEDRFDGKAMQLHLCFNLVARLVKSGGWAATDLFDFIEPKLREYGAVDYFYHSSFKALAELSPYFNPDQLSVLLKDLEYFINDPIEETVLAAKNAHNILLNRLLEIRKMEEIFELKELVDIELPQAPIINVFNKGFVQPEVFDDKPVFNISGSVCMAIKDMYKRSGAGIMICSAVTPTEKLLAQTGKCVKYPDLPNVWISYVQHPEIEYKNNYSFSAEYIWFYLHAMLEKALSQNIDHEALFEDYKAVNIRFGGVINKFTDKFPDSKLIVHDYHIALTSAYFDSADAYFFLHTYLPGNKYFSGDQRVKKYVSEILSGMVNFKYVGLHTELIKSNIASLLGEANIGSVPEEWLQVNPIASSNQEMIDEAFIPENLKQLAEFRNIYRSKLLIGRHERVELNKGILEGLQALQLLLENDPSLAHKIALFGWLQLSKLDISVYNDYFGKVRELTEYLNKKYTPEQAGLGIIDCDADYEEILSKGAPLVTLDIRKNVSHWYNVCLGSDIALINPTEDGMNLVSKGVALLNSPEIIDNVNNRLIEYNCVQKLQPAVIVASRTIGSFFELTEQACLGIHNPDSVSELAELLDKAVCLTLQERFALAKQAHIKTMANDRSDWIDRMLNLL